MIDVYDLDLTNPADVIRHAQHVARTNGPLSECVTCGKD